MANQGSRATGSNNLPQIIKGMEKEIAAIPLVHGTSIIKDGRDTNVPTHTAVKSLQLEHAVSTQTYSEMYMCTIKQFVDFFV